MTSSNVCILLMYFLVVIYSSNGLATESVKYFEDYADSHSVEDTLQRLNQFDIDTSILANENKAKLYFLYGQLYEKTRQLDLAIDSYDKSINLVASLPISDTLIDSHLERSFALYLQTNDPAIYCVDRYKALEYARQQNNTELLAKTLTQNAFCYEDASTIHIGIALLDEAMDVVDKSETLNTNRKALIYNATGSLYRNVGLHQRSYDNFKKAYQTWAAIDDKQDMFNMLHNMLSQSIKLGHWPEAKASVDAQFKLAESSVQFKDFAFFAHLNAGRVALGMQDYPTAITNLNNAIQLRETTQEQYFATSSYLFLAIAYMRNGQASEAAEMAMLFKQDQHFRTDKQDMILKADAIIAFAKQDYLASINLLFQLIDDERKNNQNMLNPEVINAALNHHAKVAEFENILLANKLAINELKLTAIQDKEKIHELTLTIVALLTITLGLFLLFALNTYKKRSQTDFLTKIANRGFTFIKGEQLIKRAIKLRQSASVIIFDIDNFKEINDKYGHHIGDLAIKALAQRAQTCIKKHDLVGRIGGEEFLIVLPKTSEQDAWTISERLRNSIAEKDFIFNEIKINFTISLGLAELNASTTSMQDLMIEADKALYQAKFLGKNKVYLARQCA
ncbi:GGDEF domain-containing protein [Shewanella sp. OMA3-2]|uniref:GGDEF domain-containing protein n=1 Tax=Shewanella sp. OMA3-2 TaxID=2908650 RepID=UPI001F386CCF|nr:GGDEF domain-containing protein [Shewanella sp. OMA3-2]UJF20424.1 GGDEF domain-containing protein [Shewanella sp. OMA3-2]